MAIMKRIHQSLEGGPTFLFLFGLIFFGIGAGMTYRQMVIQWNCIQVQGKVIAHSPACNDEGCTDSSVVRFQTIEGESITFTSSYSSYPPAHEIGEEVTVFYSPDNPENAFIKGEAFAFWSLFMLIGGVLILIGFISFLIKFRKSFLSEEE